MQTSALHSSVSRQALQLSKTAKDDDNVDKAILLSMALIGDAL